MKAYEDLIVWGALLVLFVANIAVSFANWGAVSTALNFFISAVMALLIGYFFMDLRSETGMTRIFSIAGSVWLVVMFSFLIADYIGRGWMPYPSKWPIFVKLRPSLNQHYGSDEEQPPRPGGFGIGR